MNRWIASIGVGCVFACGVNSASALVLNGSGLVTDWNNLQPLSQNNHVNATGPTVSDVAGIKSYRQNNYAPGHLDGSGGLGYTPSGGEKWDLEEMHIRQDGDMLKVLLVSSGSELFRAGSWSLGDLFINHDGVAGFDHALITNMNQVGVDGQRVMTSEAGRLYEFEHDMGLQGGFENTSSEPFLVPWALDAANNDSPVGQKFAITTATHNYNESIPGPNNDNLFGRNEYKTFLYEMTVDFDSLGGLGENQTVDFHIAWGCGNDVLNASFTTPFDGGGNVGDGSSAPGVPEPATAGLGLIALGGLLSQTAGRRRR